MDERYLRKIEKSLENKELAAARAEINRLTFALAEVEALELQHGAVIARLIEENRRLREALQAERSLSDRLAGALEYIDDYALSYPDLGIVSAVAQPAIKDHDKARAALSSTGEKG